MPIKTSSARNRAACFCYLWGVSFGSGFDSIVCAHQKALSSVPMGTEKKARADRSAAMKGAPAALNL
ncbi:hypothetical protein [Cohnella cellulosilytica]|uniref:Uncharacterized protein n=1 Tax=Cohnella cellulosilytica TaxID=986710 RepID=A0ABW2FCD0_9BACL